jgi:DNA-binding NarL/FixJ family response regulator
VFRNVALGRADRDFYPAERSFAARIQPLLVSLDRHLRVINGWQSTQPTGDTSVAAATILTPRELSVLVLLAEGLTASSIARRLGISTHTVSKHQQNLYRKLCATDRLTAVLRAKELQILS